MPRSTKVDPLWFSDDPAVIKSIPYVKRKTGTREEVAYAMRRTQMMLMEGIEYHPADVAEFDAAIDEYRRRKLRASKASLALMEVEGQPHREWVVIDGRRRSSTGCCKSDRENAEDYLEPYRLESAGGNTRDTVYLKREREFHRGLAAVGDGND